MTDERVTDEELAEVAKLDAEAPPGPWLTMGDAGAPMIKHLQKGSGYLTIAQVRTWDRVPATAAFIARARALLPRLAAEVATLRADVERLKRENAVLTHEAEAQRCVPFAGGWPS